MVEPENDANVTKGNVRSLSELIDLVSGRDAQSAASQADSGLAELLPFPFLALVGQHEMKLALMLALIAPSLSGVLLLGPRGTGKTTAVRSILDLLPEVRRSTCFYGCLEEDAIAGGIDAVCPDCAKKFGQGEPLAKPAKVRLVELPLNATLEDVVGGLDERALVHERMRLRRGVLSHADLNILYVDEVNLLSDEIIDAILDASAQGLYTVRRGAVTATYRSRFTLIGSMNPEEGNLRPQIMDRFGLRVVVRGLSDADERWQAYQRVKRFYENPRGIIESYRADTAIAREEIIQARLLFKEVALPQTIAEKGIKLIQSLGIDSLRAEITMFEAARAFAAAENHSPVTLDDLRSVAPMALRLRRSTFITQYLGQQEAEDNDITTRIEQFLT